MTLKIRRILSLVFMVIFITVTPAIMLYAAGYRLGRNGYSVQRTGMFIVDSKPEGAKILIEGRPRQTWLNALTNKNNFLATPAKIKNLLPGEYNLKLELNGYLSWQKKLIINPGASTFAENIYLFKNGLPLQIAAAAVEAVSLAQSKNQAVILSADRLTFINLADEKETSISQTGLSGKAFSWSAGQNKIVIDGYLYNLNNLSARVDLKKITPNSFNYKWNGDILYYRDKNSLYRFDQSTNLPEKIISNLAFSDYLIKNGYLYLISQTNQSASLKVFNAAGGQTVKEINLPAAANYIFINPDQALLNLYDSGHKILYLIDPSSAYQPLTEILNNVKAANWADGNLLLYGNDFEIWFYDLNSREKNLITRISQTINDVFLHPNRDYIIYSTEKSINALELDNREKRNSAELIKFDYINSLILNPDGKTLYFSGKIGNAPGLYKFLLQ